MHTGRKSLNMNDLGLLLNYHLDCRGCYIIKSDYVMLKGNNMKRNIIAIMFVAMVVCLCACGSNKSEITYSNLTEAESIGTLEKLLAESGVPSENVAQVVDSVNDYNETIGADLLRDKGTVNLGNPTGQYDEGTIDEKWQVKNDMFIGYNCRLTAFELMKDFIEVKDTSDANTSALFMDLDALSHAPDKYFDNAELKKFEAMYSVIETNSSTDSDEQYKVQQKYWDKIGVNFKNNDKISLVSVYIHNHFSDEENELIVGHTGVLMDTGNDYVFFEKLSFQLPYQMIRFSSKEEVKGYLMKCYDTDTTGESAKPFVLENGELM